MRSELWVRVRISATASRHPAPVAALWYLTHGALSACAAKAGLPLNYPL